MFKGIYNGKSFHSPDLDSVLYRALQNNVDHVLITASKLQDTHEAISIISHYLNNPLCYSSNPSNLSNSSNPSSFSLLNSPIKLATTVGIHPCQSRDYPINSAIIQEICQLASNPHVKAFGEIGLDYDRFDYASREEQLLSFQQQLEIWKYQLDSIPISPSIIDTLSHDSIINSNSMMDQMKNNFKIKKRRLPLFLHMRNSFSDFITILKKYFNTRENEMKKSNDNDQDIENVMINSSNDNNDTDSNNSNHSNSNNNGIDSNNDSNDNGDRGIVHSFTGTLEEANSLLSISGIYIGINGCSLREESNLQVVKELPLERMMIESDAPWCEIKPTHASWPLLQEYKNHDNINENDQMIKVKKEKHQMDKMIKGRNEPCETNKVLQVISILKGIPIDQVANILYSNTIKFFF